MRRAAAILAVVGLQLSGCGGAAPTDAGAALDASSGPGDDARVGEDPGGDAGPGGSDGGPPEEGLVPVFLAQGYAGRTVVSCDLGRTWTADRSDPEPETCEGIDCGHHAGAARGVTFGDGWFFATFGWGPPGEVRRSRDGATWESVTEETTFAGLAYGNGRLLGGGKWGAQYSPDQGETWESANVGRVLDVPNARSAHFLPHGDGLFVIAGSKSGDHDLILSSDATEWWHPEILPEPCGGGTFTSGGVELVRNAVVAVGGGFACRSTDGGRTFEAFAIDPEVDRWRSDMVSDGRTISVWADGRRYLSDDEGQTWTWEAVTPEGAPGRTIAYGAGVYVGADRQYDEQALYRSEDGVHWERLPAGAFEPGHRIQHMVFAWIEPNEVCRAMP
ncbi:MAG TPA: sialidase family protein [Sandaracinaceae bacterium LLY-WYZ-13_1]|nr:sialidase family protein [Sandaracinaceae bacterium LLY-WYZ-13_1]